MMMDICVYSLSITELIICVGKIMIPYAILSGKLYTVDGCSVDIRILDLLPNGFTFRLPRDYEQMHGVTECIELSYYSYALKEYVPCVVHLGVPGCNGRIECIESTEFYDKYEVITDDAEYAGLSAELSREYIDYIDWKLNLNDDELASVMTEYPAGRDDILATDYSSCMKSLADKIMQENVELKGFADRLKAGKTELAFSIENRRLVDMYLKMHIGELIMSVFGQYDMEKHPLTHMQINRLYVGNPYCYNLGIDIENVKKICHKAIGENLLITFVIPPVPESIYEQYCHYVAAVIELIEECDLRDAEISVNDWGMYSLAQELIAKKRVMAWVVTGVLLNKARRDPRMKYITDIKAEINVRTVATDRNIAVRELYYPLYQTNTGTFCPLYAAVHNGERGNQERVLDCGKICEHSCFVYPEHLRMIGKYNSIFGVYTEGLGMDADRVVINL